MWKPIDIPPEEQKALARNFKKKARFLLDENLDPALAYFLKKRGYHTKTVSEVGLKGRSDREVLALAKRQDRILITGDIKDFSNERMFPEQRNPGIVVLPTSDLDDPGMIEAIATMLPIVGDFRELYRGAIVCVDREGALTIRARNFDSGARSKTRYKYVSKAWCVWTQPPR
jgi:predicted nuclease of predicted toxin-antitoxin system